MGFKLYIVGEYKAVIGSLLHAFTFTFTFSGGRNANFGVFKQKLYGI